MTDHNNHKRVLALDVHPRSFGFVVFEGQHDLLDWGVKDFPSRMAATKIRALLDEFAPSAVAIGNRQTRRPRENARIVAEIERQVRSRRIPVMFVSQADLNKAFVGSEANKYEMASALAKRFPVLASRLPPKRKCWNGEDYRMGMFDAAAAGVSYFTRIKSTAQDYSGNPLVGMDLNSASVPPAYPQDASTEA
jgi:hypothetical protein